MSHCLSNATAEKLVTNYSCNPGFYCANNSDAYPPEYCQPTVECQIQRLQLLNNICSESQGAYEPTICKPGYYCPSGGRAQIRCPAGSFCPLGSYRPWSCDALAYCPAGSVRQYSLLGILLLAIIDVGLLVLASTPLWKDWLRRRLYSTTKLDKDDESARPTGSFHPGISAQQTDAGTEELAAFVASVRRCVGTSDVGLAFDFQNVSLRLGKAKKTLLTDVTCSIGAGQYWGVMGASGAGKSTFVNVLTGKLKPTSGTLSTNGVSDCGHLLKKLIGYVPQDDIVLPELTVRENLLHSARIRLPNSWTSTDIIVHVDTLIRCLGLWEVRNNLVGDAVKPRMSGGQRKRVSIGIELAAAPMCLVLDEPTSGLDATSALSIIQMLGALSRLGVTIVCIVHQPRSEIFEAIDHLMLLSRGHQVYVGPTAESIPYFQGLQFELPFRCNPADVIIDIIAGQGAKYLKSEIKSHENHHSPTESVRSIIASWQHKVETENKRKNVLIATSSILSSSESMLSSLAASAAQRGAPWLVQFRLCLIRSLKQQNRQTLSFFLEISVAAVAGLLLGLSVFRINGQLFQGVYLGSFALLSSSSNLTLVPQMGLLCSLAIGLAAAPPGVKTFGEEKLIYWREASSGHSRSAYYVGKVVSTIFRMALSSLHFTAFYAILATPLMGFGLLYAANLLYFFCIYGLASCVSIVARREDGPLLAMIASLIIGVFGGYGPPLSTIKSWHLEWFWRMCPGTWFSEVYFYEHVNKLSYLYDLPQAAAWTGYTIGQPGLDYSMLLIIGLFYRGLAYVGLVGLHRDRQG